MIMLLLIVGTTSVNPTLIVVDCRYHFCEPDVN